MRWTTSAQQMGRAARVAIARYGIKAGIILTGGVVALAMVNRTTYLPSTSLVAALAASAPDSNSDVARLARAASSVRGGGLDIDVQHARVDKWVERFSTTMSGDFEQTLGKMLAYEDMIAAKLDARQMPRDLIYVAAIESEFNPTARSRMAAVGLWQFMSGTARRFGLTVRGRVDERKDPALATDAALAYLSNLHDRFGSWYLAAAAYNSGEGTVQRALKRVTGRTRGTDADFFLILPFLPRETQDYVPKLIAAARVGNAPELYGLTVPDPATLPVTVTPAVTRTPALAKAKSVRVTTKAVRVAATER